jgi:hypothetical protein
MKFVSEKVIDQVIESLDAVSDDGYDKKMDAFEEAQPVVNAYLFDDENFHLLTEEEQGFLQYLALIAYESIVKVNGEIPEVSEEMIGEAEEKNYEILDNITEKEFRDRLSPFFEGYEQEDLLAFAEEALLEDEENPDDTLVTKDGRETIFIAMKTLIDVLTQKVA